MKQNTDKRFLGLSIGGFAMMSASCLLMPIEALRILPGALFWGGLLIGVAFQIALEIRRRSFFKRYMVKREKMQNPRNGLLTFASNKAAAVVDKIFVVSLVVNILLLVFTNGTHYLCYVFLATLLMSFCLHCILNGRNYFHVNNRDKVRQVLENKKESNLKKGEGKK